ncbi:MAG: NUDIX domain-containing protein, partial [Pseudomonadota bacterium]|nr:NUDIX domain-containing protein [Pseudomonadota bacterium]
MNHYPHITVATVVPQQGRFLMVQEQSGESLVYNQPAGHVEVGEGLIAAAIRETYEETGWQVRIESLIGIYSHVLKGHGIHYLRHCFLAMPEKQSAVTPPDSDIVQALWLSHDEIKA